MDVIDLAVAADWEFDADFVRLVGEAAIRAGLTTRAIWPADLGETVRRLAAGEMDIRFLFDRASTTSPEFLRLQEFVRGRGRDVLDPVERLRWASDKATMHLEFIANGLVAPHTIILPSFTSRPESGITEADLLPLGSPFVIKPANTTGGSLGVVKEARTLDAVTTARRTYPADKYLLQERIRPWEEDGKRFWFRGFFILGLVQCAWWDDGTHLYAEIIPDEVERYGLHALYPIVRRIASISKLRFFSTEIVRDETGRSIVVDYVNESCDMRLQSGHADGVPDTLVAAVASRIASFVRDGLLPPGNGMNLNRRGDA
jgi:hypothetical protein